MYDIDYLRCRVKVPSSDIVIKELFCFPNQVYLCSMHFIAIGIHVHVQILDEFIHTYTNNLLHARVTSSWKIENHWCRYRDVVCGFLITISGWCLLETNVDVFPIAKSLCNVGHLVSVALNVKNKVGEPIWLIIFVRSLWHLFQYAHSLVR